MGTRSTVKFYEEGQDSPILSVYQQYDGYIEGVGYGLAKFLDQINLVNGFNDTMKAGTHANGMGCLAAQYVSKFKGRIGGLYITDQDDQQEYNYEVRFNEDGELIIKVDSFIGSPKELLEWKGEDEEEW